MIHLLPGHQELFDRWYQHLPEQRDVFLSSLIIETLRQETEFGTDEERHANFAGLCYLLFQELANLWKLYSFWEADRDSIRELVYKQPLAVTQTTVEEALNLAKKLDEWQGEVLPFCRDFFSVAFRLQSLAEVDSFAISMTEDSRSQIIQAALLCSQLTEVFSPRIFYLYRSQLENLLAKFADPL